MAKTQCPQLFQAGSGALDVPNNYKLQKTFIFPQYFIFFTFPLYCIITQENKNGKDLIFDLDTNRKIYLSSHQQGIPLAYELVFLFLTFLFLYKDYFMSSRFRL